MNMHCLTFWACVFSFNTVFYSSVHSPAKVTFLYSCYFVEYYNSNIGLFPGTICLEYLFFTLSPWGNIFLLWWACFLEASGFWSNLLVHVFWEIESINIHNDYQRLCADSWHIVDFFSVVSSFLSVAYYYSSMIYSFPWSHHGWIYCFLLKDFFSYHLQS